MNDIITVPDSGELTTQAITADLFNKWIGYIDVREKSVETYKRAIKQFLVYLHSQGITQPIRDDVIAWRDSLKADHKPTTIQTYLTAVRLFFSWTEQEGIYPNVAKKIKGIKIDKGHKKDYLTSKQSHKVLTTIDTSTLKGMRNYAIVALMLTTGVRTIEVVRANIEDLRTVGDSTALFVQGKGHDERTDYVKIAPQVDEAIRAYLKTRGGKDGEPLFTSTSNRNTGGRMTTRSISSIAKDSMRAAGYDSDRLTAHSFRHTAGTLALLNGTELAQVQQILRHTNINTTMIYQHGIERAKNNGELNVANAIF